MSTAKKIWNIIKLCANNICFINFNRAVCRLSYGHASYGLQGIHRNFR